MALPLSDPLFLTSIAGWGRPRSVKLSIRAEPPATTEEST